MENNLQASVWRRKRLLNGLPVLFMFVACSPVIGEPTNSSQKLDSWLYILFAAGIATVGLLSYMLYKSWLKQRLLIQQKTELESQVSEMQKMRELEKKFLSVLSHDLRSPVASLKNQFNLRKSKDQRSDELASIEREVNVLYLTLDNAIYWSLIQTNRLPFHPQLVDLGEIVADVLDEFAVLISLKKLNAKFDQQPAQKVIDETQIALVVRNILYQAIEVAPETGVLMITLRQDFSRTELTVSSLGKDFGSNVPLQQQQSEDKLVKPGLILSEELMKRNKGHLLLKSQSIHQSSFVLSWS